MAFTTQLDAVNTMLSAIGSAPVSSIEVSPSADVATAKRLLEEANREVQIRGWKFNSEEEVEFVPDTNDEINVGENVWRIYSTPGFNRDVDIVQLGTKIYDRKNRTFLFDSKITCNVLYQREWDELPETARLYIMMVATQRFVDRLLGTNAPHVFAEMDLQEAERNLEIEQSLTDNPNIFDSYDVRKVLGHRPNY